MATRYFILRVIVCSFLDGVHNDVVPFAVFILLFLFSSPENSNGV